MTITVIIIITIIITAIIEQFIIIIDTIIAIIINYFLYINKMLIYHPHEVLISFLSQKINQSFLFQLLFLLLDYIFLIKLPKFSHCYLLFLN